MIAGILWGIFVTHNVEKTNLFLCKVEKQPAACEALAKESK